MLVSSGAMEAWLGAAVIPDKKKRAGKAGPFPSRIALATSGR